MDLSNPGVTTLCVIRPVDDNGELNTPFAYLSSRDDNGIDNQLSAFNPDTSDHPQTSYDGASNGTNVHVQSGSAESRRLSIVNASGTSNASKDFNSNPSKALTESDVLQPLQVHTTEKPHDNVHFCVFCRKQIRSQISRHLLQVHKDNERVAEIRRMEKGSRQRRNALTLLANEGNLRHSVSVLKNGDGRLVVGHRKKHMRQASDSVPCSECHKFVTRNKMRQHCRTCVKRIADGSAIGASSPCDVEPDLPQSNSGFDKTSNMTTVEISNEELENNPSPPVEESNVSEPKKVHFKPKRNSGHKRIYDNVHFCVFCKKQVLCKIARHLFRNHKDEARVAEVVKMPKGSTQRRNALSLLTNEGNLQHNVSVLRKISRQS